jgi:hypothetical protein
MLESLGRLLIWLGGGLLLVGLLMIAAGRITGLGRLPGDIVIRRENVTVFLPLATMVLVSVVLTIVLNVIVRLRR